MVGDLLGLAIMVVWGVVRGGEACGTILRHERTLTFFFFFDSMFGALSFGK